MQGGNGKKGCSVTKERVMVGREGYGKECCSLLINYECEVGCVKGREGGKRRSKGTK